MSAPDTTLIQLNFKSVHGGLFNIYATNVPEAKELVTAFRAELLQEIYDTEVAFSAAQALASTPAPAAQGSAPAPAAPTVPVAAAPPPATAAGDVPMCEHGTPAKLVPAGIAKASGKPYRAFYACSQPRATQCNFKASV